jgi:hypothetical protein
MTMKYFAGTLAVLMLAAAATGFICFRLSSDPRLHAAATRGDAMLWLRTDFHLTDAQFAAIRRLHDAYAGTCEEHCRMIQEATRARDAVASAHGDAAALAAANRQLQDLRLVCETAITRHVRQVATLMPPEDGRRYLALVLPKIAAFDHLAAPDLQLNRTH